MRPSVVQRKITNGYRASYWYPDTYVYMEYFPNMTTTPLR